MLPQIAISPVKTSPSLTLDDTEVVLPSDYLAAVDANWNRINTEGKFFRGKVIAATRIDLNPDAPNLTIQLTDYAHYLFAAKDEQKRFDCFAVYCSAIVVTSDDYLLLGEMGNRTSTPNQIQCPGGGLELHGNRIDAGECCRQELIEEMGPDFAEGPLIPFCIKSGGRGGHIGIFYVTRLKFDAEQAMSSFAKHLTIIRKEGNEPELCALRPIKLESAALQKFFDTRRDVLVDYAEPLFLNHFMAIGALI